MKGKPKKTPRHKDQTDDLLSGAMDEDRIERRQRFSSRSKHAQQDKMVRTALMRAEEQADEPDLQTLPVGTVVQVFSVYSEVVHDGTTYLCVVRKTLSKLMETNQVVGDRVRFREIDERESTTGSPQGVIEEILPRNTVLARADSFKAIEAHPIVANAYQMLIVASVHEPEVRWGLVDRMIVAAQSGGLKPIVCLNKIDLAEDLNAADEHLSHYESLQIQTMRTSVVRETGLEALRDCLRDRTTVLAGHSGVGKSSLIRAIQPALDLRVGEVSRYTNKGRHTTTFARSYPLESGGHVIDTPGVKVFGLWNVTRESLIEFFRDVHAGAAPQWRVDSYERIVSSLA
jgi:ribosome biogenesis GTPase